MRICVPVPDGAPSTEAPVAGGRTQRTGAIGVIDNSKPRFDVLAGAAVTALGEMGFTHRHTDYVRKPSPTRPATDGEIERLGNGTAAVIIGSGD